jgi:hypothetical protein
MVTSGKITTPRQHAGDLHPQRRRVGLTRISACRDSCRERYRKGARFGGLTSFWSGASCSSRQRSP